MNFEKKVFLIPYLILFQWSKRYPGVPFHLDGSAPGYIEEAPSKTRLSYDIVEAALRQGSFFYQVSLPHYRGHEFLRECLTRYKMYLCLKAMHRKVFLVPCYDIDLIWHTHQVRDFF